MVGHTRRAPGAGEGSAGPRAGIAVPARSLDWNARATGAARAPGAGEEAWLLRVDEGAGWGGAGSPGSGTVPR